MSPFFTRKFNEPKDGMDERPEETKNALPLGGLMRSNTGGNGPASPWGPSSATTTMSPMGNFGNFSLGGSSVNPPTPDKRPAFGRVESRLAHLMPKDSTEDMSKAADRPWRPRQRTDTDPFADEPPAGLASFDGAHDGPAQGPQRQMSGHDTPVRGLPGDFGMSDTAGLRDASQRAQQTPQAQHEELDQFSPANTNPYGSPPDDRLNPDELSYDGEIRQHSRVQGLGGIPEHGSTPLGGLPRGFSNAQFEGSDRSQTSSAGASRGFPPLGGLSLGGIGGGWPTSANPVGTPDRENRQAFSGAFGNSLFGSMGELQSPGLGGLGGVFGQGTSNVSGSNTTGRGSKLGSLFPAAMQAQMQGNENDVSGEGGDMRQNNAFGTIGRNAFTPSRETDSPLRAGRHVFDDMFPQTDASRTQGPFSTSDMIQGQTVTALPQVTSAQANYQPSQTSSDSTSNQLPMTQQREMVMPDRMRWVYLDPQGQVQGPWSGLEMHDWYKASFFTADLSVKKVEDQDFEPLGQLIRRIGNSREPFLVPQIGIPHGTPSTQPGVSFTSATAGPGAAAQPGSVQPPFAGAFPSFGTTLTAEQQNNLERRKQEEQFLMARQREFLAQQQVNMKQMQMGGGIPASLHHHSSAHSLQSQPSFGSITSPIGGMAPQGSIPGVSSFFDGPPRPMPTQTAGMPDFFRGEDVSRLNLHDRFAALPLQQQNQAQLMQQIFAIGQPDTTQRPAANFGNEQTPGVNARLDEFLQLREEHDKEEAGKAAANVAGEPIGPPQHVQQQELYEAPPQPVKPAEEPAPEHKAPEVLSLTQQVQKAASAKHSPSTAAQPESPWAKVNTGLPMPFPPPPQSTTPLPAPTAQRGRSHLPEALNAGSRSRSETPEVTASTPSLAPWAKEQLEAPKGPSLKEIQAAEAKKAARAEEKAVAARRVALEQERKMLATQPAVPLPGLPTTSTWGSGASPATPVSVSPWAKSTVSKPQATHGNAASKKTLADIQREEEARKQKLAAAHAALTQPAPTTGGKRYADLAGKPTASGIPTGASAWSTVGAGGKVKVPSGSATAAPAITRSASSATTPTIANTTRPLPAIRSVTQGGPDIALTEFKKWATAELKKGLNDGIDGMHNA